MATDRVSGDNFRCFKGVCATFFGVEGARLAGDDTWLVQSHETSSRAFQNVQGAIGFAIGLAEGNGYGNQIARVVVEPVYAVVLYLGGALTNDHLLGASQGDGVIVIPAFTTHDRTVMLVVNAGMKGDPVLVANAQGTQL